MVPSHIDSNGFCYDIKVITESSLDPSLIESLYKSKLPSFQSFPKTGKVVLNTEDFENIIKHHANNVKQVAEITGRSPDEILSEFAEYHKQLEFVIQPNGISGLIHKVTNGAYVSGAAVHSVVATSTSHISGITGMSRLGSSPALLIIVPLVGGIFFGSLERLGANTPAQPVLILARDACLIPLKIAEIIYNHMTIGPILRVFGIDAPLNVTSMLKFGAGTKTITGSMLNTTLNVLIGATPNLFDK